MDILRKMFGMKNSTEEKEKSKDEFRKPTWFEDYETDDELFDSSKKFMLDIFTNPFELQKYFEQQIQDMFKTTHEEEGKFFDRNFRDEYMKPGFEDNFFKEFKKHEESLDTDLDGEIYADQLHSLLQRLQPPEVKSILPDNSNIKGKVKVKKEKLSDEELIMGKIHGTINEENNKSSPTRRRDIIIPRIQPQLGGAFEGTYQGPKMFRQSVMTQTIRKPDGSYETKKVISDSDGNVKTTVTRTKDGKTETITSFTKDGEGQFKPGGNFLPSKKAETDLKTNQETAEIISSIPSDRNIFITKQGYAMPRNMW